MTRLLLVTLLAAAPASVPLQTSPPQGAQEPAPQEAANESLPAAEVWQRTLAEVAALTDDEAALRRIAELEAELGARLEATADTGGAGETPVAEEAAVRLAELLVRVKIPRQSFMAQGASAQRAIKLLEDVLDDAPERIDALFLHAVSCANMPEMFGKRAAALASFEKLLTLERKRPGSVPYPSAFARLARMRMEDARRALETGLAAFPDDPTLRAMAGLEEAPPGESAPPTEQVGGEQARASKQRFREALLDGKLDFESLDAALAAGQRLQPEDHEYPLFRGLLRLWRMESTPDAAPALTGEAEAQFRLALELQPEDTRIYGWLGPLLAISGQLMGDPARVAEGEALMDSGVRLNPEQNLFARAYADRTMGTRKERIAADLYRTFELCSGEEMDRTRFLLPESTEASVHPACGDPAGAPYNRAGTAYWAAEFFRSQGEEVRARDAYRAALRLDPGKSWPHRALAEERLAWLADREIELSPGPVSCMLCHQAR